MFKEVWNECSTFIQKIQFSSIPSILSSMFVGFMIATLTTTGSPWWFKYFPICDASDVWINNQWWHEFKFEKSGVEGTGKMDFKKDNNVIKGRFTVGKNKQPEFENINFFHQEGQDKAYHLCKIIMLKSDVSDDTKLIGDWRNPVGDDRGHFCFKLSRNNSGSGYKFKGNISVNNDDFQLENYKTGTEEYIENREDLCNFDNSSTWIDDQSNIWTGESKNE